MINPKNICISAVIGFVLSFFIGLISGVNILHLLIRAVIFAAVFAALAAGITYVFNSFLSGDLVSDSGTAVSSDSKLSSGSVVNIVVDDSTLKDDTSSPKFSVVDPSVLDAESLVEKNKKSSVEKKDPPKVQPVKAESNVTEKNAEKSKPVVQPENETSDSKKANSASAFVPADLNSIAGGANNISASDSAPADSSGKETHSESVPQNEDGNVDEESIAELPDIGSVDFDDSSASSASVITDSDFATGGSSVLSASAGNVGSQDAATMAKAIATLLAKDNE